MKVKPNTLLIRMQEVEHTTESGFIIDQESDNLISHGELIQEAVVYTNEYQGHTYIIPEGSHIMYSKDRVTVIEEGVGVVEFKNVVAWEEK